MISALQSDACMDEDEEGKEVAARVGTVDIVSPSVPGVDLNERRGGGTDDVTMAAEDDRLRKLSGTSLPLWWEEEEVFREEGWGVWLFGTNPGQLVVPCSSCLSVSEYLLASISVLSASRRASNI